jgi:hypothetical protein
VAAGREGALVDELAHLVLAQRRRKCRISHT